MELFVVRKLAEGPGGQGRMILPANQSWAWGSDQENAALRHSEIQLQFAYGVCEGLQGN